MSINNNTISRLGHLANVAAADIEKKYIELVELEAKKGTTGSDAELDTEIAQVNRDIDHDFSVIKLNDNFTEILKVEEKVQEEANHRKVKKEEDLRLLEVGQKGLSLNEVPAVRI